MQRQITILALFLLLSTTLIAQKEQDEKPSLRNLQIDDYFQIRHVSDPQLSFDGKWVAFTVTTRNLPEDSTETRVWMVSTSGGEPIAMTAPGYSAWRPRWSPDNQYLTFLAAKNDKKTQVWRLFRNGGDSTQLTDVAQGVGSYEWSPNGQMLALVITDPESKEGAESKAKKPWVINSLQFKRDGVGYLDEKRDHIYIFDCKSKKVQQITSGNFDDSQPVWSPDSKHIAFVSNRTSNPDGNYNTDIWLVAVDNPDKGKTLRQITTSDGAETSPVWSPDGKRIAYESVVDSAKIGSYATNHLAIAALETGQQQILSKNLDRNVSDLAFAEDGNSLYFIVEEKGESNLARVNIEDSAIERIIAGEQSIYSYCLGRDGKMVVLITKAHLPLEVFLWDKGKLSPLTAINAEWLKNIRLGEVEKIQYRSKDETQIETFVVKPPGFSPTLRYPTILRLHGGPMSQYSWEFLFDAQLYAAHGYLVVLPNPRGSTGYGQEFCVAIWQAWGEKDYEDVIAAVDCAIERGYADSNRLGVGGWSYGGILTNYVITKTDRFKAAITGASEVLYVANYGHDHYQRWWELELGLPWENRALWEKLSPFNQVEKIVTPTLILCGEKDWNVPVQNSEQLYQALRRLGRTTQLVVYPGQTHSISTPSFIKDRFERYLAWYDKYMKNK